MLIRDKLLSKRLAAIYDWIEANDVIADIGTDHAYLITALVKDQKITKAFGVDNKEGPLKQAEKVIAEYGVTNQITLSLEADQHPYHTSDGWVIAGLGFETISQIISKHYETIKNLKYIIIQSNTHVDQLRVFLMVHQLHILDEKVVYDDFYYPMMKVQYRPHPYHLTQAEILMGPILLKNKVPPFNEYCEHLISINKGILAQIPSEHSKSKLIKERIKRLEAARTG